MDTETLELIKVVRIVIDSIYLRRYIATIYEIVQRI